MNDIQTVWSETRRLIIRKLGERKWFNNTSHELQQTLINLPEDAETKDDWNGFLIDLVNRPETLGGVTQIRINKVLFGNYGAIVVFDVANTDGKPFTYEYFSWKHGSLSGAKGIVFVRADEEITHFVVLRGEKFAPAQFCWDTTGGFADIGAEGVFTMNDRIRLEIQQELGAENLIIDEVHDLGRIMTDAGQTNNNPGVFAAVINAKQAEKVSHRPINADEYELAAGVFVFPMEQLPEIIMENGDTFFQTSVLRSVVKGIIPASCLVS